VTALVLEALSAVAAALLLAVVLIPYLLLLLRGTESAAPAPAGPTLGTRLWTTVAWIAASVALIVLGSVGMVETAVSLARSGHVSQAAVGLLILGPLTSIPNAATAVRLGMAGRGSALVSETFNSNTINLVVGVAAPALVVSIASSSSRIRIELLWMVAMTAVTVGLLAQRRGMGRAAGLVLIVLYVGFVAVEIASG
jgi:cation:H+ antiporter